MREVRGRTVGKVQEGKLSKPKQKDDKPEFGTWFACLTCNTESLSRAAFIEHLKAVHHLEPPLKGKRQMDLHLDCRDHYMSAYSWDFGTVQASENTVGPRS